MGTSRAGKGLRFAKATGMTDEGRKESKLPRIECDEDNAYNLKNGMIVTGNPYYNCGKCYSCQRGLINACINNETLGCQRDGAFSTYFVMPEERVYDGKGVDAMSLAAIEPFSIGYHGVKRANLKAGDKVLVVGAGTIGVVTAISAKLMSAEVTICDVAPAKLEIAKQFGIDHILLNDNPDTFMDKVNVFTDGNGFDTTFEAVGMPSTMMNGSISRAFSSPGMYMHSCLLCVLRNNYKLVAYILTLCNTCAIV